MSQDNDILYAYGDSKEVTTFTENNVLKQLGLTKVTMDELKDLVQKIDVGHDSDFNGYINPHGLIDTRHKIQDVRQKIYQKFSEMGITVR